MQGCINLNFYLNRNVRIILVGKFEAERSFEKQVQLDGNYNNFARRNMRMRAGFNWLRTKSRVSVL
jgi:hypothetical protein